MSAHAIFKELVHCIEKGLARISHTDQWKGGQSVMPGFENREEVNIASILMTSDL